MLNKVGQVYLALGPTDLRKAIDGLAVIVQEHFQMDLFSRNLYVFCNQNKDKLKILEWDHDGFGCTINDWRKDGSSGRTESVKPWKSMNANFDSCWMDFPSIKREVTGK